MKNGIDVVKQIKIVSKEFGIDYQKLFEIIKKEILIILEEDAEIAEEDVKLQVRNMIENILIESINLKIAKEDVKLKVRDMVQYILIESTDLKLGKDYFKALGLYIKITGNKRENFYNFDPDNVFNLIGYIRSHITGFYGNNYHHFFPSLIEKFEKIIELFGTDIQRGTEIICKRSCDGNGKLTKGQNVQIKSITKGGDIKLIGMNGSFSIEHFIEEDNKEDIK